MTTVEKIFGRLATAAQGLVRPQSRFAISDPTADQLEIAIENATGADPLAEAIVDLARHYGIATNAVAITAGLPLVRGRLPLEHVALAADRASLLVGPIDELLGTLEAHRFPIFAIVGRGSVHLVWSVERDAQKRITGITSSPAGDSVRLTARDAHLISAFASAKLFAATPRAGLDERGASALASTAENWFLAPFKTSRKVYAEAIAATVAINLLALAMPLFTMNIYDRVLPNAAGNTLWALAIGVTLATLFDFALKTLRALHVDAASRRADVVLANFIYGRLLGAKLSEKPVSAGVRANTLREFETLREFFNSATLTTFGDLPFVVLFLIAIAVVGGPLVLIAIVSIPIVVGLAWMTQRRLARMMEAQAKDVAQKNAVVVETLVSLEAIKATGAESWAAGKWEAAVAEHVRTGIDIRRVSNLGVNIVQAAQTLVQVAMIIIGFYMVAQGSITTGALIASTMLVGRVLGPIAQIAMLVTRLHQTRIAFDQLNQVVNAPQERPAGAQFITKATFDGAIAFDKVSFHYDPQSPPALSEIAFAITPGERVAIIGGIGSGKTTLIKLIQGLHSPSRGRVLVDGVAVSQIDPANLRSDVALVLQDCDLFHGTIRSNITIADPGARDAEVMAAASASGALDWIAKLPSGFDTAVRERGAGLSGGQRQSVALARALLKNPRVLLLDEPTSAMDGRSEQQLIKRLQRYLQGKTMVLVTHRPAMLDLATRLIVLEGGRIVLDGPKDKILETLKQTSEKPTAVASVASTTQRPVSIKAVVRPDA